mmetsp:Transcript_107217/g.342061  ORF Transcript_107217/g.342061 Transcript_107217/m.342061 type:complete len:205 (-) Transcript_107217:125-739(-)
MARRLWASYTKALVERPVTTNILTGGSLGFTGDVVCQLAMERQERMDWRRCLAMTAFGTVYSGNVSYWVYKSYSLFLPTALLKTPLREGLSCSAVDNFVHVPLLYTPCFYIMTEVIRGATFKEAQDAFKTTGPNSIVACWAMWLPYQAVNFGYVAPAYRTAFMNIGCLVWNVILDFIANNPPKEGLVLAESQYEEARGVLTVGA